MKAVDFKEVNVRLRQDQPQYKTLPAYYNKEEKSMTFCFELNPDELEQIGKTGKIFLKQLTFNQPLQPIAGSCVKNILLIDTTP